MGNKNTQRKLGHHPCLSGVLNKGLSPPMWVGSRGWLSPALVGEGQKSQRIPCRWVWLLESLPKNWDEVAPKKGSWQKNVEPGEQREKSGIYGGNHISAGLARAGSGQIARSSPPPVLGALCGALEILVLLDQSQVPSGPEGPRCCLRGGPEGWHMEGKEHGPCPFSGWHWDPGQAFSDPSESVKWVNYPLTP